jgi:hypothetical protein
LLLLLLLLLLLVVVIVNFHEVLRRLKQHVRPGRINRFTIRQEGKGKGAPQ